MQDITPSLSELSNYRPNAELAQGDRNVVPEDAIAIQAITQGARDAANMSWNKYVMFQKNLADNIKEAKFDYNGIRPQDKETLMKKAASFYAALGKDPSILGNPSKNPIAYAEMMQAQQGLQSEIAKSKSANEYTMQQMDYQAKNPELRNSFNDTIIKKANETPLEQWSAFQLKPPTAIDFGVLSKEGLARSMSETMIDEPIMEYKKDDKGKPVQVIENGKPKFDEQGNAVYEQYYTAKRRSGVLKATNQDKYRKYGDALWESNERVDKYGTKLKDAVSETFELLPENQKEDIKAAAKESGEKDPLKFFYKTTWDKYYTPTKDLSGIKAEDDKAYMAEIEQKNKLGLEAKKFGYDVQLELLKNRGSKEFEAYKYSLGQKDKKEKAKALLQLAGAEVKNALQNAETFETTSPDGTKVQGKRFKLTPQVLQLFGEGETVKEEADGTKEITYKDKPDYLEYIPSTKNYKIVFLDRDKDGNPLVGKNGKMAINKSKAISEDQFITTIGNSILPKGQLADAYQYAKEEMGGMSIAEYVESGKLKGINVPSSRGGGGKVETMSGVRSSTQYKQPVVSMK